MQNNKIAAVAILILFIFFINGCASFKTISNATRKCPKFYSGVRLDINAIASNEQYIMSMNRDCSVNPPKYPLVDLPFSFILDTLFTPLTTSVAFYEVAIEPIEDWFGN